MNDYVNIFGGLLVFALGVSRRNNPLVSALAVTIGASKVAEGVSGYSPWPILWQKVKGTASTWQGEDKAPAFLDEDSSTVRPIEISEHQNARPGRQAVTRRL